MEGHKNKKHRLPARLQAAFIKTDMPLAPPSGYRIELSGRKRQSRVLVSGAHRILVCSGEQIVLETRDGKISFDGVDLDCLCYEGGVAEILGFVRSFSLLGEEGV